MGELQHLTKQSMKMEAVSHLRRLQKQPDIVRSFFIRKPHVMPHNTSLLKWIY